MKTTIGDRAHAALDAMGLRGHECSVWSDFQEREDLESLANVVGRAYARSMAQALLTLPLQSPLERVMYLALVAFTENVLDVPGYSVKRHSCLEGREDHSSSDVPLGHIGICCQHRLGRYRLDFLVTAFRREGERAGAVAVEVDGHDFHERTKEQAAHDRRKDRVVQAEGLRILRFTGSEVWKDPIGCAKEVVDSAFGSDVSEYLGLYRGRS